MAKPLNGLPFLDKMARTSPTMAITKPMIKPTGKQQQLTSIETIPRTREVTAMGLAVGFTGGAEFSVLFCRCPYGSFGYGPGYGG